MMTNLILFLIIIFSIFYILLAYEKYRRINNAVTYLCGIWTIICIPSAMGLFGLYIPEPITYVLVLFSIISFSSISLIGLRIFSTKNMYSIENDVVNTKLIVILHIISYAYIYPFTNSALSIFFSSGFVGLRAVSMSVGGLGTSLIDIIILQWVIQGLFVATIVIACLQIVDNEITVVSFLAIIDVILFVITFAGRKIIFQTIVLIYLSYTIYTPKKRKIKIKKNKGKIGKIGILTIILLSISTLIYITSKRTLSTNSILSTIYIYFSGGLIILDSAIKEFGLFSISNFLFGSATIAGLLDPFLAGISIFTGINIIRPNEIVLAFTAYNRLIGDGLLYNAFCTWLYAFIRDFGILGPIIIPAIYAGIIEIFRKKTLENYSIFNKAMYIFLLYILINSVIQWDFTIQWPWFTISAFYLFLRGKRKWRKRY